MPRKNRTPTSQVLNRENQRRCRERRRELIHDLQQRVLQYERRDAQATLEMQQTARALATENAALREMLAARCVAKDEIDAYLTAWNSGIARDTGYYGMNRLDDGGTFSKQDVAAGRPIRQSLGSAPSWDMVTRLASSKQQLSTTASQPAQARGAVDSASQMPPNLIYSAQHHGLSGSPQASAGSNWSLPEHSADSHTKQDYEQHTYCACIDDTEDSSDPFYPPSKDPACYCPPEPSQECSPVSSGMHCSEAAAILAQLKNQPDLTLARAQLGCAEGTNCIVQNTDLLQLVD